MKKRACFCLLLCGLLLLSLSARADVFVDQTPPEDWQERPLLRLTVFRTGEGDAMLLQVDGENMMIDGGPYKYREKLRDALTAREISHFKYLFNTHPHDDHIDGLRMLMSYGFEVEEFISVFPKNNTYQNQKQAVQMADRHGIPYRQLANEETVSLGSATLTFYTWEKGSSINAKSAMARLEYGDCSALLCADIIGDTQRHFLNTLDPAILKADVVKAPHHGLTPFVTEFLTAVDPAFVWVTNYNNDLVTKISNQMRYRGLPVKFSGAGTVYLECDGADWYVYQTLGEF